MSSTLTTIRACLVPQTLESDPGDLQRERSHEDYLRCHCSVCGKQQLRFQDMTRHLALEHGTLATTSTGLYQHWSGSMCSPCCFCQTSCTDAHHCKVLFQLMVLQAQCQTMAGHPDQPEEEPVVQTSTKSEESDKDQDQSSSSPLQRLLDAPLPHICIICADTCLPWTCCVSICGPMTPTTPFGMQPWVIRLVPTAKPFSRKLGNSSDIYHDTHALFLIQHFN